MESNRKSTVLDYGHPDSPKRSFKIFFQLMAALFAVLTVGSSLFVVELLHNDIFWPMVLVWIVCILTCIGFLSAVRLSVPSKRNTGVAKRVTVFVLVLGILYGGLMIYDGFTRPDPHVVTRSLYYCQQNINLLHTFMQDYASRHDGIYPNTMTELAEDTIAQGYGINFFTSPAAHPQGNTIAPTTQSILDELKPGDSPTYIYLAKATKADKDPNKVLIYDAPTNHKELWQGGDGMHVLYGDGKVKWLEGKEKQWFLKSMARK